MVHPLCGFRVVNALFTIFELFGDRLIFWLPLYYELKVGFNSAVSRHTSCTRHACSAPADLLCCVADAATFPWSSDSLQLVRAPGTVTGLGRARKLYTGFLHNAVPLSSLLRRSTSSSTSLPLTHTLKTQNVRCRRRQATGRADPQGCCNHSRSLDSVN